MARSNAHAKSVVAPARGAPVVSRRKQRARRPRAQAAPRTEPQEHGAHWSGLVELLPLLRNYLASLSKGCADLDELTSEIMVRAASSRLRLGQPRNLRAWMLTVAANVWRDHVRRTVRRQRLHACAGFLEDVVGREAAPQDVPLERSPWGEDWRPADLRRGDHADSPLALQEAFDTAFERLRDDDRRLLTSFYVHDRRTLPTAEECGIPRAWVKVRVFRARRRLRGAVDERLLECPSLAGARPPAEMEREGAGQRPCVILDLHPRQVPA